MADRNERAVLNELIVTCRDAARGFEWAADHVHDSKLQALFRQFGAERSHYESELVPHAQRLGGDAEGEGSRAAQLHRAWMTLKDRLAPHRDQAIVAETERGERAALAVYNRALNGMLPPEARDVIEAQQAGIQKACDHLHSMAAAGVP